MKLIYHIIKLSRPLNIFIAICSVFIMSILSSKINWIISFIESVRSTKSDFNLLGGEKTKLIVVDNKQGLFDDLKTHSELVCKLARLSDIELSKLRPRNAISVSGGDLDAFIPISEKFNIELEKERIIKSLKKIEVDNSKLLTKLENKDFLKRAPNDVVEKFTISQKELASQINKQSRMLENLESLSND